MKHEIYHLYGIKILVSGDTKKARALAPHARRMQFQLGLSNVPQLQLHSPDGSFVRVLRQAGQDFAWIHVPITDQEISKKREWQEVNYLPAWEAYDGPSDEANSVGVIICRGNGFNGGYEFIPTLNGKLPDDIPDESDFEEAKEKRYCWKSYIADGKKVHIQYRDVIPTGVYDAHNVVGDEPNNAMSLTWTPGDFWEATCTDHDPPGAGPLIGVVIGCVNSYSRSNYFNLPINISFGPSYPEENYWDPVFYEGADFAYKKPQEHVLNFNDGDLFSLVDGSGNNQTADIAASVLASTCEYGFSLIWPDADYDENWYPTSTTEYGRNLHGIFSKYTYFSNPEFYLSFGEHVLNTHYEVTTEYHLFGDLLGSIEDENKCSLIYSIQDTKTERTINYDRGCSADTIVRGECYNANESYDETLVHIREYSEDYKIALSNVSYDVDDLPELVGMLGPDDADGRWANATTKYFRIGSLEIGLYWLQGLTDDMNFVSNYIEIRKAVGATKENTSITITPLTGNHPWNTWYQFPDITDTDGNPVYIRDACLEELKTDPSRRVKRGELRLIEEIKTIKEI